MNFCRLTAWYTASNYSKVRQDPPNLFFPCKSMKSEKFPFLLFLATLKIAQQPLLCDRRCVKHYLHRKIFAAESIHITIQTSKYINGK